MTNIMGYKEIVSPETGFVVSEKNVEELREAVERFAQLRSNDKTSMGLKARQRVKNSFNSIKQAQQLSRWIENPAQ